MDMVNQKNGCTHWSLRFLEVQTSAIQLISQEYLDFIQDSNQNKQNQEKSLITGLTDDINFLYVG